MRPVHLLYIAAILALAACQERISLSTEDSAPGLVIYGYITTDTTAHAVRITRSSGYFAQTPPQGISGADVSIASPNATYPLSESPSEPGLYLTEPDVYGLTGESYTLRVSLDFGGKGRSEDYEATTTIMPPPELDSIGFSPFTAHDRIIQVMVWGRMPQTTDVNYFSSYLYINGRLYNDSLSRIRLNNDRFLIAGREIKAMPLFFLNQDRNRSKLSAGDTVSVQLDGIPGDYSAFLYNAQGETQGSNPIFDGPPANVPSNIRSLAAGSSTLVLGFFGSRSKSIGSVVYE
ncbi:MAG: DUF4249 domain-containing protein [Tannerellaceae bacterium]|jgi:hypothetical protein|nr:DUF4249 domain-containing protein [Tannerellaceae bacterium]